MDVDVTKAYLQKYAACILKTDDPQFRNWAYNVQFTSVPFFVADPPDLNLGTFKPNGKDLNAVRQVALDLYADSKVELTRDSFSVPDEMELTIITSSPEARWLPPDVWNTRYHVTIGLSPKGREAVLHGSHSELITKAILVTAGDSRRGEYSVYWQVLAPLVSHPSYLSFGNLLDEKVDHGKSTTISSTTDERFRIVSVESAHGDVQIESSVDSSVDALQHRVRFKAPEHKVNKGHGRAGPRRFLSGTIHVRTTDKLQPIVEIPWSAMWDPSVRTPTDTVRRKSSS